MKLLLFSAFVLLPLFNSGLFGIELPSHCSAEEDTIFTCKISKSKKIVSICVSKDFSSDSGYIQYRFGRLDNIEYVFPKDKRKSNRKFLWQSYGYSGGWDTRIQFSIKEYTGFKIIVLGRLEGGDNTVVYLRPITHPK